MIQAVVAIFIMAGSTAAISVHPVLALAVFGIGVYVFCKSDMTDI
jgi:hypothetical protein|tara:strand:- start:451 stop:585 length:135 start_codon:yes stop_codon:yes gene_type:complete